jgi:broad specificity phosphatase PhoE
MLPELSMSYQAPNAGRNRLLRLLDYQRPPQSNCAVADYGTWVGRGFEELRADQPEGIVAWLTDPVAAPHGGESIVNLIDRVVR